MNLPVSARTFLPVIAIATLCGCAMSPSSAIIERDDFRHGTGRWIAELESGGSVTATDGTLELDVPAGATLWFSPELSGPLAIEYTATVIDAGGPNDRVSDLNCFWMATDSRSPGDLFATRRSGKFEDYNALRCYYASIGGNSNTTTRFRRYIGSATTRPLEARHDLRDADKLLEANRPYRIRLIADESRIEFWRDGERLFELDDPEPYRRGRFALRTVHSHIRVSDFRVVRLAADERG